MAKGACVSFFVAFVAHQPPFLPGLRNGLVLFLVMPGGKSMLDNINQSHEVHGCLKPVNHGLDLVRHDGRFLAGRSTPDLICLYNKKSKNRILIVLHCTDHSFTNSN